VVDKFFAIGLFNGNWAHLHGSSEMHGIVLSRSSMQSLLISVISNDLERPRVT